MGLGNIVPVSEGQTAVTTDGRNSSAENLRSERGSISSEHSQPRTVISSVEARGFVEPRFSRLTSIGITILVISILTLLVGLGMAIAGSIEPSMVLYVGLGLTCAGLLGLLIGSIILTTARQQQLHYLQDQKISLQRENDRFLEEAEKARTEKSDLQETVNEQLDKLSVLRGKVERQKEEINEQAQELKRWVNKCRDTQTKLRDVLDEWESDKDTNKQCLREIGDLKASIDKLEDELIKKTSKVQLLSKVNKTLQQRLDDVSIMDPKLLTDREKMLKQLDGLIKEQQQQFYVAQEKLQNAQQRLNEQNDLLLDKKEELRKLQREVAQQNQALLDLTPQKFLSGRTLAKEQALQEKQALLHRREVLLAAKEQALSKREEKLVEREKKEKDGKNSQDQQDDGQEDKGKK